HADDEGPPPAVLPGHDEVADERRGDPADSPEGLEDDDDPAPDGLRGVLADERRGDRQLGAEAEADDEAQDDEHDEPGGQRRGAGGEPVDEEGEGEDLAAADAVGEEAADARADRHADEPDGDDPRPLPGGESPLHAEGGDDEGDEPDVHRVERPADAGAAEELA